MIGRIKQLAQSRQIHWKKHALKRLLERNLLREHVFEAQGNCEIIDTHDVRRPLPTFLVLGYHSGQALHIVLAVDELFDVIWIITVYEPSSEEWKEDFKTRKRK